MDWEKRNLRQRRPEAGDIFLIFPTLSQLGGKGKSHQKARKSLTRASPIRREGQVEGACCQTEAEAWELRRHS